MAAGGVAGAGGGGAVEHRGGDLHGTGSGGPDDEGADRLAGKQLFQEQAVGGQLADIGRGDLLCPLRHKAVALVIGDEHAVGADGEAVDLSRDDHFAPPLRSDSPGKRHLGAAGGRKQFLQFGPGEKGENLGGDLAAAGFGKAGGKRAKRPCDAFAAMEGEQ